jgi:hypothetical protein
VWRVGYKDRPQRFEGEQGEEVLVWDWYRTTVASTKKCVFRR